MSTTCAIFCRKSSTSAFVSKIYPPRKIFLNITSDGVTELLVRTSEISIIENPTLHNLSKNKYNQFSVKCSIQIYDKHSEHVCAISVFYYFRGIYVGLLLILGLNAVSDDAYYVTTTTAGHFGGGLSGVRKFLEHINLYM